MDTQTFWNTVEGIADEFNIGRHPLVKLIKEGKATRQQIRQFAVEHYEMTVRDSGHYIAQGYISMATIDKQGAEMMAENFVEEGDGPAHPHRQPYRAAVRVLGKRLGPVPAGAGTVERLARGPGHERLFLAAGLAQGPLLGRPGRPGGRFFARLRGASSTACKTITT